MRIEGIYMFDGSEDVLEGSIFKYEMVTLTFKCRRGTQNILLISSIFQKVLRGQAFILPVCGTGKQNF